MQDVLPSHNRPVTLTKLENGPIQEEEEAATSDPYYGNPNDPIEPTTPPFHSGSLTREDLGDSIYEVPKAQK